MSLAVMGKDSTLASMHPALSTNDLDTSFMVAVFITANISGGHLNPAVTLATIFTGHIKVTRGLAYIFLQICGACFGILMVVRPASASLTPCQFVYCYGMHGTDNFASYMCCGVVS